MAGVLDELAASFAVSQGRAGLLMSLYALVYALLGPLLVYLSAGIERRRLLAGALLAFIGANLASAAAPSFALLLASRLLVAASASVIVVVAITWRWPLSRRNGAAGRSVWCSPASSPRWCWAYRWAP